MIRTFRSIRLSAWIAALACGMGLSSAVQAQVAGTYAGSSADGSTLSFLVSESGGVFSLNSASINFVATCAHPGGSVSEGWGFFLGTPVSGGQANFLSFNDYYYISGTLHFANNATIKGTITSLTATFVPGTTPPTKAQYCKSPKQAFTATFQGPASMANIAPGAAVVRRNEEAIP